MDCEHVCVYDVNGGAGVMRPTLASGLKVRRRIGGGAHICIDLTAASFINAANDPPRTRI